MVAFDGVIDYVRDARSSSRSTVRPGPARAPSRARSRRRSGTATSTAARCTARSAGRRSHDRRPARRRGGGGGAGRASRASTSTPTRVTIDGVDVTRAIRTPEIDRAAASVARLPRVRAVLVERQRADGRGRRRSSWKAATSAPSCSRTPTSRSTSTRRPKSARAAAPAIPRTQAVRRPSRTWRRSLTERDDSIATRAASPLYAAPDAVVIDTTGKSVDEVVDGGVGDRAGAEAEAGNAVAGQISSSSASTPVLTCPYLLP